MKKVLLLIISIIFTAGISAAYETVLVDFPPKQLWKAVVYQKQEYEAILQYVPQDQTAQNWTETLIFHSYKKGSSPYLNGAELLNATAAQLEYQNNTAPYRYIKYAGNDAIATRCVKKNNIMPAQCEILRATNSFDGLISMHYINKDTKKFQNSYKQWLYIIRTIKIYQSYYRDNRILDKAQNFEL